MYNINNIDTPPEFFFDKFKIGKTYTLIFYDFNHPEVLVRTKRSDGYSTNYLRWVVFSEKDYTDDGIPKGVQYMQQMPQKCFEIAYSQYKYVRMQQWLYLKQYQENNIVVRVTFTRRNRKSIDILNIELLDVTE